jgi:hypothetical protein
VINHTFIFYSCQDYFIKLCKFLKSKCRITPYRRTFLRLYHLSGGIGETPRLVGWRRCRNVRVYSKKSADCPTFPDFSRVKYRFDWFLSYGGVRLTFRNQIAIRYSSTLQDSRLYHGKSRRATGFAGAVRRFQKPGEFLVCELVPAAGGGLPGGEVSGEKRGLQGLPVTGAVHSRTRRKK